MSWTRVFAARARGMFSRTRRERELEEEVRFHLEMQIEDNLKIGMSPERARNAALRSFGGIESMKEIYRDRSAFAWMETTTQDIRYAVRTLRKSPGFTATAVAVLALAIGANTAMFSVLNAVLLRPLPYPSPKQLVMLWSEIPSQGLREGRSAYWNVEQWRSQSKSFAEMAFFDGISATLTNQDRAERISATRTSPNLFALLGVQPLRGRIFSPEEAEQRQRVALISHRFWQARFAASPDAIGATINLDGAPFRIVGILPPDFRFGDANVWQPHTLYPDWENVRRARGSGFWNVLGRLRPGVTIEEAQAEMNAIARHLDEQSPAPDRNRGIRVTPLSLHVVGTNSRLALWMLSGAVLFVLLIAATNVASLSLARGASRDREIAIRVALGASRARIVRQLVVESLMLTAAAGMLGLLLAAGGIRVILASKPVNLARLDEVSLDPHVLGWALFLCILTGILVGLAPARIAVRRELRISADAGGRGTAGIAAVRARRTLVITEIALAMVLLAGAGLLVRSLWSVEAVDLGFRPERVLLVWLAPPASLPGARRADYYQRVLKQVQSLPGLESAGVASEVFIGSGSPVPFTAEGNDRPASGRMTVRSDEVSDGFFHTIGTPLLRGRAFSPADGPDSQRVAIINDQMARRLWPGRDPVGRRFKLGAADSDQPWFTVVGIAADMRRQGFESDPIPQMFQPLAQNPPRGAILVVRTLTDDPLKLAAAVQVAVRSVEKYAPVYAVTTLETQLGNFVTQRRFQTSLLAGFSIVALLIAAIGIYGLIQYSVATRTHEIGIRMAVGAQTGDVFRMIIGEGLKLSLTGVVLGLGGASWLAHELSTLLFGVTPADPLTFVTVSLLLTAVAVLASYLPARRAMKIEPITALRQS
jgi:predicted permease